MCISCGAAGHSHLNSKERAAHLSANKNRLKQAGERETERQKGHNIGSSPSCFTAPLQSLYLWSLAGTSDTRWAVKTAAHAGGNLWHATIEACFRDVKAVICVSVCVRQGKACAITRYVCFTRRFEGQTLNVASVCTVFPAEMIQCFNYRPDPLVPADVALRWKYPEPSAEVDLIRSVPLFPKAHIYAWMMQYTTYIKHHVIMRVAVSLVL